MNSYQKEYQEKNKDRLRIAKKLYRINNWLKIKENNKLYYEKHKEEIKKKARTRARIRYWTLKQINKGDK